MGWEGAGGGELMGWGRRSRINLGVGVQSDHQDEMYFSVLLYSLDLFFPSHTTDCE
jgi:hypothetical protein